MRQAAAILLLFLLCVAAPVGLVSWVLGSVGGAVTLAAIGLALLAFMFLGDAILHRVFGARIVESALAPELFLVTEGLATRLGVPRSRVGLIETAQANGFATLRLRPGGHGTVLVSRALLRDLTRDEAEAAVAILIARLQQPESRAVQVAASLGSLASVLLSGDLLRPSRTADRPPGPVCRAVARVSGGLGLLLREALGFTQDWPAADRMAAARLDNPLALGRALSRLDGLAQDVDNGAVERHPATRDLFLVDPLRSARANAARSHPTPAERTALLKGPSSMVEL